MMMIHKLTGIAAGVLLATGSLTAQTPADSISLYDPTRYVTRATLYGVGVANMYDTYLSPQEYRGVEFRFSRESMRMTRWADGNLSRQSFFQGYVNYTHNHVNNNNTLSAAQLELRPALPLPPDRPLPPAGRRTGRPERRLRL